MTLYNPSPAPASQPTNISNAVTTVEFNLTTTPATIAPDRTAARNRRGLILYNDGTANALFSLGTSVTASIFTAELLPGGYFCDPTGWQGPVVAAARNNPTSLNVTEPIIII